MKNIIIIGSPRSGKSSLANLLADLYGYQIIRIDTLRRTFKDVFPDMNITSATAINHKLFKKFVQHYFDMNLNYHRNKYSYILEGYEITIKDYQEMFQNENTLLCVLGLSDLTPNELLANIRKYDTNKDWSTKYDNEYMLNHCKEYISYSKENKMLCQKNNLLYFETSYNRDNILKKIVKEIEKNL